MNDKILYSDLASALIANGYAPTSLTNPGAFGYRAADDAACVATFPSYAGGCGLADASERNLLGIVVAARDKKIRAAIIEVLENHGIEGGPVRVASDGSLTFVVAYDGYTAATESRRLAAFGSEFDCAMGIDARDTSEQNIASGSGGAVVQEVSALIRIDGTWKNGDLFTVPRSKLPAIDSLDDLSALVSEVERAISGSTAEYKEPPMSEHRKRAKAKRERLDAELAKRTELPILQEVERRIAKFSPEKIPFGTTTWAWAALHERASSAEGRIAEYDAIVAERAVEARRSAKRTA